MSTSTVLQLDELRVRRERRLQRAFALYRTDPERMRVVEHLAGVASLLGCDRVATVWVDEYGPGLVHTHTVLDLLSEIPRRRFSVDPLRLAWNEGVPGKIDLPDVERSGPIPLHDAARSLCAVAMGSDGSRAWFLVADGMGARVPLDHETSGQLMFLAGECAGVLLHRDLHAPPKETSRERFSGWPILRDIEGHETDEALSRRIGGRFLVARALRSAIDDDLALDPAALSHQLDGISRELASVPADDPERPLWDDVLQALEQSDWRALAATTLALAKAVEDQGHGHGARELYTLAHGASVAAATLTEAVESARLLARLLRRQGHWDEAIRWYEGARAGARVAGAHATEAIVIDGLASAVRDKGNLRGARQLLHDGLQLARESSDDYALASIHHTLMSVERLAGRLPHAVAHGWRAMNLHREEETRYYVLVSLAGCFVKMGELDAAEDSYAVVAERVARPDWRFAALETLAHISALRSDRLLFEERAERADSTKWRESASIPVHAQILQFRAMSWRALGEAEQARSWFERARDYAEEHGVNQVLFEAENALQELEKGEAASPPDSRMASREGEEAASADPDLPDSDIEEIREGVGALRRALVPTTV